MININFVRENPDLVKENMKKRFMDTKIVDTFLKKDEEYRKALYKCEQLRHKRNLLTNEIRKLKKAGKKAGKKISEAKKVSDNISKAEDNVVMVKKKVDAMLFEIPNIMDDSVPIGKIEADNREIMKIGKAKEKDVKSHVELGEGLGIIDFEDAGKVAGNGFHYLKGDLALLDRALINYAVDFMLKEGFDYVEPPLMIKGNILKGVCSHEDIEQMAYKIDGDDLYPIATSEHPLIGQFIGKVVDEEKLPMRIVGYSPCFRKEVGSHGIDERGLFRTHHFNKVEMVVLCKPEESDKMYKEMFSLTKKMFKSLNLPGRFVEWCSGELGPLRKKAVDLEYWSPRKKDYAELGSLSHMADSQALMLDIRYTDGKDKEHVHTLNNTVIATSRMMVAILENNQLRDGSVKVPKVLHKYMGKKVIGK